jgi:cardiolipin synthase
LRLPPSAAQTAAAFQAAGWSRSEVVNVPNAISLLRLLSGPLIASWILEAKARPLLAFSPGLGVQVVA